MKPPASTSCLGFVFINACVCRCYYQRYYTIKIRTCSRKNNKHPSPPSTMLLPVALANMQKPLRLSNWSYTLKAKRSASTSQPSPFHAAAPSSLHMFQSQASQAYRPPILPHQHYPRALHLLYPCPSP
jgi:hypothetical protein